MLKRSRWLTLAAVIGLCLGLRPAYAQVGVEALIVEDIVFVGNDHTRDFVLSREMHLQPGDPFDPPAVEADRQRIMKLGLFDQVMIQPVKGEHGLVLWVMVVERWYLLPAPILIVNDRDWDHLSYGASLKWENIGGRNITAAGTCWFGFNRNAQLRYTHPWLFGRRSLVFDVSLFTGRMPHISADYPRFDLGRTGLLLTLGRRWRNNTTLSMLAGYQRVTPEGGPAYTLSGGAADRLPLLGVQVKYDRRDDEAYPRAGWYALGEIQAIDDGDAVTYARIRADVRRYQPVIEAFSIAGRLSMDALRGAAPMYEHLLIGQQERIRGWFYELAEGENRLLTSVELRTPVWRPGGGAGASTRGEAEPFGLSAALFVDSGSIWYRGESWKRAALLSGYGAGLHLHLPFVRMVRFERAWRGNGRGEYIIDLYVWF